VIRLATGPVSWGVDFAVAPGNPAPEIVLDGIKAAGFEGTELGPLGYLPDDLGGLELAGGFVFEPLDAPTRAAEVARHVAALGGGYVLLIDAVTPERAASAGRPDRAPRLGGAALDALLEGIGAAAEAVLAAGLRPLVHPHAGTRVEFTDEIALVSGVCDLCVDTGHCAYSGVDPALLIARLGERLGCVHLKDLDRTRVAGDFWRSVAAGAFVPVGSGCVDFGGVLATLRGIGYDGWAVIEQDRVPGAGDPIVELEASRLRLERLLAGAAA
jgi:inosose dehydratase